MEQLPLWDTTPAASVRRTIPLLSKSRFGAGLQCHKRLYLELYSKEKAEKWDPMTRALFEMGKKVGLAARGRFAGGVTVNEEHRYHDEAVLQTAAALSRPETSAIYEAAFTYDDLRVRIDILASAGGGAWDLVEVKSSAGYKEDYLTDIGIQLYVAEGAGVPVRRVCLLHVNTQYVFEGFPYDLERLFTLRDLSVQAREVRPKLLTKLEAMRVPLWSMDPPDIAVGSHCKRPYVCPFYVHCHDGGPRHPLDHLPRLNPKLIRAFRDAEIDDIRNIPEDFDGLTDLHRRIRASVITGRVHSDPELKQALDGLVPPIHFLDFETCNPALPRFLGTRPFEQIPFQWSDHVLLPDGSLEHREYLHLDETDPREAVVESLIRSLGSEGRIVVYSGFEERIIRTLAEDLPEWRADLLAIVESRMFDLLEHIRSHYYHPEFKGSFSIKDVLPALIDDLDYDDLEIREGGQAAAAYLETIDPGTPEPRRLQLQEALRAYCHRDTEAMVRLFKKLRED
ncbi:MAG TPA: DUF2779 domain-containing protein [Candidatus Limnocylindrales bacterium]|nr:DUF2779 domain-containing protein [Candidatus Limnocylindrales bacterium]